MGSDQYWGKRKGACGIIIFNRRPESRIFTEAQLQSILTAVGEEKKRAASIPHVAEHELNM